MTEDAYASAGVSQSAANAGVEALVSELASIDTGEASRVVPLRGHYASVLDLGEGRGLALCTDGVGTKLVIAERLRRWDTVGIDCVAMNVNDLVCVGAKPLAMLDYVAVPSADPQALGELGRGLRRGAELARIEIPGGELAQLGEVVRGLDLVGAAVGLVELDAIITGAAVQQGDPVIGLPASGLHSNGYTLARKALADVPLDDRQLGRPLGDVLLDPTEIYVPAVLELLAAPVEVRGLAHITGGGLQNLLRLEADVGYEIDDPLPVAPIFGLIQTRGEVADEEMYEVFNMGCGFCCIVAAADEQGALEVLRRRYPGAKRIGRATDRPGEIVRR
jgi:phosphoribosylformylglycinamidine cyclo-ligase